MKKTNAVAVKLIYVAIWTLVMCYASFHAIFEKGADSVLNCEKSVDLASNYIFPLFTAVALYLIDGIYNGLLLFKQDRPFHSIVIITTMLFFFVGFLFSVYANSVGLRLLMFCMAWIALGGLKFYETPALSLDDVAGNVGQDVSEN